MRLRRLIVVLVGLMVACGPGPGSPTPTTTSATVVSLLVTGPATLPPGQSAQFKATAFFSHGPSKDYTTMVGWSSVNPAVASVSSTGLVTGVSRGETPITASVLTTALSTSVMVVPAGEFRLSGLVTEAGLPVAGVALTVISGVETGLSTVTTSDGRYVMYGVAGSVQVQAARDGYAPVVQTLSVNANSIQDFSIAQTNVRNVAGVYAMTVTADPACPAAGTTQDALPDDVRSRHYLASITQNGVSLHVALSGADFLVTQGFGSGFDARLGADRITFTLGDGYYSPHADLLEVLGPNSVLLIDGTGALIQSGQNFDGELDGLLIAGSTALWTNNWSTASCFAHHHRVVLTRQTTTSLQRTKR